MYDINTYCPERRGADKYGVSDSGAYFVMSEVDYFFFDDVRLITVTSLARIIFIKTGRKSGKKLINQVYKYLAKWVVS